MISNPFELYIDRLKNDDTEEIYLSVVPSELDLQDQDLSFKDQVTISGHAYLANNHLILDLKIKATALLPCTICNGQAKTKISIEDFSHTVELSEVKSAIYNFKDEVRAAILLKIPQFVECDEGHCPHRTEVNKYLNKGSKDTHSPFSELEIGS